MRCNTTGQSCENLDTLSSEHRLFVSLTDLVLTMPQPYARLANAAFAIRFWRFSKDASERRTVLFSTAILTATLPMHGSELSASGRW